MPLIKTEAVVLRTSNYREKSKIVTLYTSSNGKLRCIAKGVRDVKSRWGGVLQSLACLNVILYIKENRTLQFLSGADYSLNFTNIYDENEKTEVGFRMAELVNMTTPENQENKAIFNLLKGSLENLNSATKNYINLLFNLEFKLAKLLGFGINIEFYNSGVKPSLFQGNNKESIVRDMARPEFTRGDVSVLKVIDNGSLNALMNLKIPKETEKAIESFFERYYQEHVESFGYSPSKKVIKSKDIYLRRN